MKSSDFRLDAEFRTDADPGSMPSEI